MTSAALGAPTLGWLHRRFGWGEPSDTEADLAANAGDAVAELFAPRGDTVDPWGGRTPSNDPDGRRRAIRDWFGHAATSATPIDDRRTFELHGWIVSSLEQVPIPLMVEQLRRLASDGAGSFPDLLRAITVDAAMLLYLDGYSSQAQAPNENYARELLELFSLGTGLHGATRPYSENDVAAAAAALTGWTVQRPDGEVRFVARRHDDTPRPFLGASDVSDVDGVIDAIVAHPEHDRFVASQIARRYVGVPTTPQGDDLEPDAATVDELADVYRAGGRRLDAVIEAAARIVANGLDDPRVHPIVSAPIPWLLGIVRGLGIELGRDSVGSADAIRAMGQLPMVPPSVAGWPSGRRWLTTSSLVARTNVAAHLVAAVPNDHPAAEAAADGDVESLAALLGAATPFSTITTHAIRAASDPGAALTLALVSPEYLLT